MKIFKSRLFAFMIGAVVFGGVAVYADSLLNAKDVLYAPNNGDFNASTVKEGLDELYTKSENYKDVSTTTVSSADDIIVGKTAYLNDGTLATGTFTFHTNLHVTGSNGSQGHIDLKNTGFSKFKYTSTGCDSSNTAKIFTWDSKFKTRTELTIDTDYTIDDDHHRLVIEKTSGSSWCYLKFTFFN